MLFCGHLMGVDGKWQDGYWQLAPVFRPLVEAEGRRRASREQTLRGWALPGFVDGHCHIGVAPGSAPADEVQQRRHAHANLLTGVLTVRDAGSPVDASWMRGDWSVPHLIRCGRHIARPMRYIRGLAVELEDPRTLPEDALRQLALSDGWVKLVGDWIDRSAGADADLRPLWPRGILVDAVAAVHAAGGRVAVHCFSRGAVDDLLEAGVDDIEHGSGMDADQLDEARRRGVLVSPTLMQVELFRDFAEQAGTKYPVYAATMRRMWEERREHAGLIMDSGVQLIPGTDSGGYQEHGSLHRELRMWEDAGCSSQRLAETATVGARRALNVPLYGLPGQGADLLFYSQDPTLSREVLSHPRVVRAGVLYEEEPLPSALS